MADEDMLCLAPAETKALHLYLRALAAIDQQIVAVHRYYLCRGVPPESRQR